MKITYENGWEYTDIHADLPVPYEDSYQMRMLRNTEIPGLLGVKGSGRDGSSRYTWRVSSGISVAKKFEHQGMKKQDVEGVIEALVRTGEALADHMLSPDGLMLTPELIYTHGGKYGFCYLPASAGDYRVPVCRSFHQLTEYFTGHLDYHDTEGIFLVYKLHKETMKESYELKKILEECREEEKTYRREQMLREKKQYGSTAETPPEVVRENAEASYPADGSESAPDREKKKGFIKRTVSRIRTGRWGEWQDLITEMDDGKEAGR